MQAGTTDPSSTVQPTGTSRSTTRSTTASEPNDREFVGVSASTLLSPGRIHCHLTIPSSSHTRNAQIEVLSPTTVAVLERRLAEQFGEDVEVFEACRVADAG